MTALRILHIEDEPDIREIVEMSLCVDPAFSVRGCASGEDGIAAAAEDAPDLILLDVMMPGMDGPTTLANLRQNPLTAAIPVIFMTARAQSREIEQFKSLGAAGVIAKPFDPMTLAAAVRRHAQPAKHTQPAEDVLAVPRAVFLRRARRDAEVLIRCWSVLDGLPSTPSVLARTRELAHGLAGAAGIFGYHHIGAAAADLEKAVIIELDGKGGPRGVELALENLLTGIGAIVPEVAGPPVRLLDA